MEFPFNFLLFLAMTFQTRNARKPIKPFEDLCIVAWFPIKTQVKKLALGVATQGFKTSSKYA